MPDRQGANSKLRIYLAGRDGTEEIPDLTVHLLDAAGAVVRTAGVDKDGEVAVSTADLGRSAEVLIGPAGEYASHRAASYVRFHATDVAEIRKVGGAITLAPGDWTRFLLVTICVEGSISACRWWPWYLAATLAKESVIDDVAAATLVAAEAISPRVAGRFADATIASRYLTPFPVPSCRPICRGFVEVFQRHCCCEPIFVRDPRLEELLRRLRELVAVRPPHWPPPPPEPPYGEAFSIEAGLTPGPFDGGPLNEAMVHAPADIVALATLDEVAIPAYVAARPYLRPFWCSCGGVSAVASGTIRPDGTFSICWREPLRFEFPGCHEEYAFVVRQLINGQTVVVYNGLVAGQWFRSRTGIHLTTYDWRAIRCTGPDRPDDGTAFVVLEKIGASDAYHLKTPDQNAWNAVAISAYNDGLAYPATSAATAVGQMLDRNWGGGLGLWYRFSEGLQGVGARFYRITVTPSDGAGNPTGTPAQLHAGMSWLRDTIVGTQILVANESLGPQVVGTEANLYRIPYNKDPLGNDMEWHPDQVHGVVNTAAFLDGRYLVMLEVFDQAGHKLRPAVSTGPGTAAQFTYQRWMPPTAVVPNGPMVPVPYAALTHLFWWDNRAAFGHIEDIREDGLISSAECQFLVGTSNSRLSAGIRAYHPNPMFLFYYNVWWHRGLGPTNGQVVTGYTNQGQPPSLPAATPQVSFGTMLGPSNPRCSFALNLLVRVKTTNGSSDLSYLDASDQAAFALET
jgi:hypothetical protein